MKATTNRNSDERIDAVLRQLHSAEPLPGMEDRLLERLRAHALERPAAASIFSRWRLRLQGFAVPVCAALLVLAMTSVVLRRHPAVPVESPAPRLHSSEVAARTIASAAPAAMPQPRAVELPEHRRRAATLAALPQPAPVHAPARLSAEDELAREEASAPSHPAPELPLTAEERHLQRAVRGREPVELAELQPDQRAAARRRESAEFQQFFDVVPAAATQSPQQDPNGGSHDQDKALP